MPQEQEMSHDGNRQIVSTRTTRDAIADRAGMEDLLTAKRAVVLDVVLDSSSLLYLEHVAEPYPDPARFSTQRFKVTLCDARVLRIGGTMLTDGRRIHELFLPYIRYSYYCRVDAAASA